MIIDKDLVASAEMHIQRVAAGLLKAQGLSRKEIAEKMGLSERQVKRRLERAGHSLGRDMTITAGTITADKIGSSPFKDGARTVHPTQAFFQRGIDLDSFKPSIQDTLKSFNVDASFFPEKDSELYSHEEANTNRDKVTEFFNDKYKGKPVKILNLADLHIPFTDYKNVVAIIKKHKDADILMLNGDIFDLFAVSKYAKDKEVALKRELEEGREFLEYVSKIFKDVVITEGNHERRLKNYVINVIPTDMQFLFPQDIFKLVVSGEVLKKKPLNNVHIVGSWWVKLFDVIFAHPDNYAGANLKTVQNTSEHFLLVKNVPHRMCIIGHTHRAGWLVTGEIKLMETGCLCFEMDYHNGSKFTRTKWTEAYAVVHIDKNGQSDFNESTVFLV